MIKLDTIFKIIKNWELEDISKISYLDGKTRRINPKQSTLHPALEWQWVYLVNWGN